MKKKPKNDKKKTGARKTEHHGPGPNDETQPESIESIIDDDGLFDDLVDAPGESPDDDDTIYPALESPVTGRRDKEYNHTIICTAFYNYIRKHGRPPTNDELAQLCDVGVTTIKNHLKTLKAATLESRRAKYELMFDDVMGAVAIRAAAGDTRAAKLFMQLMGRFTEKKELDISDRLFEKMDDKALAQFIANLESTTKSG